MPIPMAVRSARFSRSEHQGGGQSLWLSSPNRTESEHKVDLNLDRIMETLSRSRSQYLKVALRLFRYSAGLCVAVHSAMMPSEWRCMLFCHPLGTIAPDFYKITQDRPRWKFANVQHIVQDFKDFSLFLFSICAQRGLIISDNFVQFEALDLPA